MPGMPCCCTECIIFSDQFDRADNTELGFPWYDDGPEFSIISYDAVSEGDSTAYLDVIHPIPDTSMVVTMKTREEVENGGVKYRILVNIPRLATAPHFNSNNLYFAEFERNGLNDSVIRLGIISNGVTTILKEEDIIGLLNFNRNFIAIFSDTEFCASVSNATLSFVGIVPPAPFDEGYYCGMRIDTEDIIVEEFIFEEHFKTNPKCLSCLCKCNTDATGDDSYFAPKMHVRIYPDPENCTRLDLLEPCEFDIEWNRLTSRWEGSHLCCESYDPSTGQLWEVLFNCPTIDPETGLYDPYTATLAILTGCTSSCGGCGGNLATWDGLPTEADCSPQRFLYGPFLVTELDLSCFCSSVTSPFGRGSCNYYIEVTAI
jgi:hypothetical protein